jgi:class 3 adenylate cyclase
VITYDGRGTGSSEREPRAVDDTLDGKLRELEAVIDQAAPRLFALAGVVQGGFTAIAYAAREPERVTHLILSNCAATGAEFYDRRPSWRMLRGSSTMTSDEWEFYTLSISNEQLNYGNNERARKMADTMRSSTTPGHYFAAREATEQMDVRNLLPKLRVPTLVIHDRYYGSVYASTTRTLAPLITGARYVEATDLAATIDEFLREGGLVPAATRVETQAKREPSAFRTVLFTDLVGHTEMMQRLGDEKGRDVLREHERITREVLKAHGGTEVKTMGDGFLASFGSVTKAVECAIALQKAFAEWNAGGPEPLHVRVGLNAGEPIEEEGDLFGSTVILASRIASAAKGGEILAADVVHGLCSGKPFAFSDRGEQALRGFENPVRLYEVSWRV